MTDRLTKLRAWIYLHAQQEYWEPIGFTDAEVLRFSEEKLKLVALGIIIAVAKDEGGDKALKLAAELEFEIGYRPEELRAAKAQMTLIMREIWPD